MRRTLAFGVDLVSRDALANDVVLNRSSALLGQLLVVSSATDAVSVTNSDNDFEVQAVGLGDDFINLGFAFRTQRRLVEVEERIGSNGDLVASRLRASSSAALRLADFFGDQVFVAFAAVGIRCSSSRSPEASAPAQAGTVRGNLTTAINHVDAIGGLGLSKRGTEAKSSGKQSHHRKFNSFIHLDFPR